MLVNVFCNVVYGQYINPSNPNIPDNATPAAQAQNIITYQVMRLNNKKNVKSVVISTYGVFYPDNEIRLKTLSFNEQGELVFKRTFLQEMEHGTANFNQYLTRMVIWKNVYWFMLIKIKRRLTSISPTF